MTAVLDKEIIRKSLKYWIEHDPNFVEELLLELKVDLKVIEDKFFEDAIAHNFNKYEQTFKALA